MARIGEGVDEDKGPLEGPGDGGGSKGSMVMSAASMVRCRGGVVGAGDRVYLW